MPASSPQRRRVTVILNRESGTVMQIGPDEVITGLEQLLAGADHTADVRGVAAAEIGDALAAAVAGDADAVWVGGGDGTVAAAAAAFAGKPKPLGILPLGTLNLAARDVGMPMDWQQAATVLMEAPVADMDLLDIDGRLCFCMAVLGFYPALAMGRPEYHGHWLVKAVRTLWETARNAATFPPLTLVLQDDENGPGRQHRTRLALLANNDYEDVFGVLPVRRSLDGGYLSVWVSTHRSRLGMAASGVRWVLGRWTEDREVVKLRAGELRVDVKRKRRVPIMLDGELDKIEVPFRARVRPRALRVITPAPPGGRES